MGRAGEEDCVGQACDGRGGALRLVGVEAEEAEAELQPSQEVTTDERWRGRKAYQAANNDRAASAASNPSSCAPRRWIVARRGAGNIIS